MQFLTKATSFAVAIVASASVASAQVNFSTSGVFGDGPTCNTSTCMGGGFTLQYLPVAPGSPGGTNIGSGSNITLGNFVLTGTGNSIGGTVPFTLTVTQTTPSSGSRPIVGSISGSVQTSPFNSSTLVFTPSITNFSIGAATYNLITDAGGGYAIPINNALNPRGVTARVVVSSVPEPSTYAMMGMGLAGLLAAARRRRTTTTA